MKLGSKSENVKELKMLLNIVGDFGLDESNPNFLTATETAVKAYQKRKGLLDDGWAGNVTMAALRKDTEDVIGKHRHKLKPIQVHIYHPVFDVPAPYTHLHPIDVLRSVAGEKEIKGSKNNGLIAHFHEHAGNLGTHSEDKNDYSDEVPHCASAQNWAQDMSGCEKSNHALASSYEGYAKKFGSKAYKKGDTIPEGAIICIKGHVTRANKKFVWTGEGEFEGFGSNQGNTIKTSMYAQSKIRTICDDKPKKGTKLAPIGLLGHKRVKPNGSKEESTR